MPRLDWNARTERHKILSTARKEQQTQLENTPSLLMRTMRIRFAIACWLAAPGRTADHHLLAVIVPVLSWPMTMDLCQLPVMPMLWVSWQHSPCLAALSFSGYTRSTKIRVSFRVALMYVSSWLISLSFYYYIMIVLFLHVHRAVNLSLLMDSVGIYYYIIIIIIITLQLQRKLVLFFHTCFYRSRSQPAQWVIDTG